MDENTNTVSFDELKNSLENFKKQQINQCQKDIADVLMKYNCRLTTLQEIRDGQPGPVQISVILNP